MSWRVDALCIDWGGTLMSEDGPPALAMALWPRVARIEGALALLRTLHGQLPVHLATNARVSRRPAIEKALSRAGLRRYIDRIYCHTELGLRKEDPAWWAHVSADLGVPCERLAMLGDSLEADVRGPARCGVQALWFNEGARQPLPQPPVPMVSALSQVPAWLLAA